MGASVLVPLNVDLAFWGILRKEFVYQAFKCQIDLAFPWVEIFPPEEARSTHDLE